MKILKEIPLIPLFQIL